MICFRLGDTYFSFEFAFFAVIALICVFGRGEYILLSLLVCACHEMGHLIVMALAGQSISAVKCTGLGIRIIPQNQKILSVSKEILILLGGAAVNFILAVIFMYSENYTLRIFSAINFVTGIFNMFPYTCLDGGSIILKLLQNIFPYIDCGLFMKILCGIFTALIIALSIYYKFGSMIFYIIAVYLLICEIIR